MILPTESLIIVSGLPGAGKSLFCVEMAKKFGEEGVTCYSWGLHGASSELFETLDEGFSFSDWQTIPKGSVVFFDEAHKLIPQRVQGAPPKFIADLTEIRHFGLRFVFITQDPRNLDVFVRRLVGRHFNLKRKMGFNGALVTSFDKCADDVDDYDNKKTSTVESWKYPKELFNFYKSASLHVVKRTIPKKVIFYCGLILLGLGFAGYTAYSYSSRISSGDIIPGVSAEKSGKPAPLFDKSAEGFVDLKDYLKKTTPLSPVLPWSAPVYAESLEVKQVPGKLVCYIGSKGCRCFSEQMVYKPLPEPVCVGLVRDGIDNPYQDPYPVTASLRGNREGDGEGRLSPHPCPISTISTSPSAVGSSPISSPVL